MNKINKSISKFFLSLILILLLAHTVVADRSTQNAGTQAGQGTEFICVPLMDGCSDNGLAPSEQVFFDNFESGRPNPDWDLGDGWYVTNFDGRNYVIRGSSFKWAVLKNHEVNNFIFSARFQRNQGALHFCFRVNTPPDGLHRYFVSVDDQMLVLTKQFGQNSFNDLAKTNLNLNPGWHTIAIEAKGGNIRVLIDSKNCICFEDGSPILTGGISLETIQNSDFVVDDVYIGRL